MARDTKSEQDEQLKEIDQRLDAVTNLVSNRVRTIAGGVIVFAWSIIVGAPEKIPPIISRNSLLVAIALSLASLIADLLQYAFSWLEYGHRRALFMEHARVGGQGLYTIAVLLFISKVILMGLGALWMVVVLGRSVLLDTPAAPIAPPALTSGANVR